MPQFVMAPNLAHNLKKNCAIFNAVFAAYVEAVYFTDKGLIQEYADCGQTWEQFGHDFWLTRNGHGAEFWDRGIGTIGEKLTEWAKSMGSKNAYQGDDGLIYFA